MSKRFFIISLGPGNPETISIQALKALESCQEVFVQTRSKEKSWEGSVAFKILSSIIKNYSEWFNSGSESFSFLNNLENKLTPVYTSMNYTRDQWHQHVQLILESYNKHDNIGYVTLGDASIHSSAYYLLDIIEKKHKEIFKNTQIIPGITSYSYASTLVKKPLCIGDTSLQVIPKKLNTSNITKVNMRLHKAQNISDLSGNDLYYFKNLGFDDEEFGQGLPENIDKYLTLIIDFASPEAIKGNNEE